MNTLLIPSVICAIVLFAISPHLQAQDVPALTNAAPATNDITKDHPLDNASKLKLRPPKNRALPTLYLVGDSTMRNGTKGQVGWGDEMAPFFNADKINVVNDAIGGRSSRSFQTEGRWNAVLATVKKGDFVVIEFGHNDAGPVNDNFRARGSIPGLGDQTQEIDNMLTKKHEIVHTYGWYMSKYVTDTQAKGATPIIMSLTPRNSWNNGKVVRASGENYGGWSEQAAKATGAIFVDHNEIIAEALDALGQPAGAALFANAKHDGEVHTRHDGAVFNARMAVAGLKGIVGNPFGPYLSPAADSIPAFKSAPAQPTP